MFFTTYFEGKCLKKGLYLSKCPNSSILYTSENWFFFFYSSFDLQKFHHLLRCHVFLINYWLIFLRKGLAFFKFNIRSQNSGMNNSIRTMFIKIIIKINIIKIYIKNTHFITRKHDITRIFIKLEYKFTCVQNSKKIFNHFTCNKPNGNNFQCC